jgi:hypothetical protein
LPVAYPKRSQKRGAGRVRVDVEIQPSKTRVDYAVWSWWQRWPVATLLDWLELLVLTHRAYGARQEDHERDHEEDGGRGEDEETRLHHYSMLLRIS